MRRIDAGNLQVRALRLTDDDRPWEVLTALRKAGHPRPLVALARALSASPPARALGTDAVMVVREDPARLLVAAGRLDEASEARLSELPGLLREAGPRLRILSWPDVERACEQVATQIRSHLAPEELARCVLVGIPRGGLVVAGLLAYALEIPRDRIRAVQPESTDAAGSPEPEPHPVVLVDDCAISGVRLRETLSQTPGSRILVASLCSHPELRSALLRAEPRVIACVAGMDLNDHGPALLGPEEAAWRSRWSERVPQRYHTALLDLVSFPWSEPQVRLWNPVTGEVEAHWWLAPPEGCIEHRHAPPGLELQLADDLPDTEWLAPGVVPIRLDDATVLVDCDAERGVVLSGTALELWRAWIAFGLDEAAERVAGDYGESPRRVRRDLVSLLDDLRSRGLMADEVAPTSSTPVASGDDRIHVQATAGHVSTEVDGEVVIMAVESGQYLGLKGVGTRIWRLMEVGGTLDQMAAVLEREYEVEPERCRQDLIRLIDDLERRGLVERVPKAPTSRFIGTAPSR